MTMDKELTEARRRRQERLELRKGDASTTHPPLVKATPASIPQPKNHSKLLGAYWMLDHWAVLAFVEGDRNPFVCWHMDEKGYCYWGRYFDSLNNATHHWVHNMVGA